MISYIVSFTNNMFLYFNKFFIKYMHSWSISIFSLFFIAAYSSPNETSRYLCNHRRAYRLFTDSISPKCSSTAFPCESYEKFERGECFSCSSGAAAAGAPISIGGIPPPKYCGNMGYYSDKASGRGSQYLLTRDGEPFCGKRYLWRFWLK